MTDQALIGRSPARASGSEYARILLVMATFVGVAYLVYLALTVPKLVAQAGGVVAGWYVPVGTLLAFGPGVMLLAARRVRDVWRWTTVWALACPVGLLAAAGLWGLAGVATDTAPAIWMLDFAGVAAVAVAVVGTIPQAIAALVVCKSAAAYVALAHQSVPEVGAMAREAIFGILFSTLFVCVSAMVVRSGTELDQSRSAAAQLVSVHVRNAEIARFDGLIHDHVISTLVAVGSEPDDPRVAHVAAATLRRLDALSADPAPDDEHLDARETVARLRAVIDPQVETVVKVHDAAIADLFPSEAVRALAEAVGEAVRNSLQHAGPDTERAVMIEVGSTSVTVNVVDDGDGFDPDRVGVDRLGLDLSVRRRVNALPGGHAAVVSAPGAGTMVEVSWTRP